MMNKNKGGIKMFLTKETYKEKREYEYKKYTFPKYLIDESNYFAYEVTQEMATVGWKERNTLIIYGNYGLGKRHLAYALLKELFEKADAGKVCCVQGYDCEHVDLMKEVIQADAMMFLNVDVAMANNEFVANSLLNALIHCREKEKIVIMTMDYHPDNLPKYKEDFSNAVYIAKIVEVTPPSYDFCVRMIRHWINVDNLHKFNIGNDVINYVARVGSKNFRILEGTLNKLIASSLLEQREINLEFAKEALSGLDSENDFDKKIIIHTNMSLEHMVNNDDLPVTVYLDLEKQQVAVIGECEELGGDCLKVPTIDELAPFKSVILEYVSEMNIPITKTATKFLKENSLYMDFLNYRLEYAVSALRKWLYDRKIEISYNE